jgi:hypothetical protein
MGSKMTQERAFSGEVMYMRLRASAPGVMSREEPFEARIDREWMVVIPSARSGMVRRVVARGSGW